MANQVIARVYRKQTCFGPGDKAEIRVILTSKNVSPVKIKSIAFSIRETVTFKGNKRASRMMGGATKTANQRTESVAQKAQSLGIKLYKGDVKTYDIAVTIPKTHTLMTIQTAKHIEVSYTMRVYVDTKQPIILDHLPMTMTNVSRNTSANVVPEIGFVPGLSSPLNSKTSQQYGESIQRPMSAGASPPQRTPTQSTGSTVKPGPQRSFSFLSTAPSNRSGESTYPGAGYANLNRRDTVMTTASGPGMAGRGVPGHVFNWQQQGDQYFTTAFGQAPSGPKPAFAGPASIYEGRELAPEENRALFHHSFQTPLGQVFEGTEPVPAVNYDFHHQQEGYPRNGGSSSAASSSQHLRSDRQSHEDVRPTSTSPQDAAEAEKERLYQRARQQAEKNQRRAAEAAAAAALGAGGASVAHGGNRSVSSPTGNEKQILFERARREAERYQAGYAQGATFPQDDYSASELAAPSPNQAASRGSSSSDVAAAGRSSATSHRESRTQFNAYPSAAEEKSRLYEAAKAERDAHLASPAARHSPAPASPATASSSAGRPRPQSTVVYPTVMEEKQRFAAAQAERDAFLRAQGQGSGSSSVAPPPSASNGHSRSVSHGFLSAEEEKKRLYDQAKAEAEASQPQQQRQPPPAPPPITVSTSRSSMLAPTSFPSAEEEKRRLYEQAKAEVDAHTSVGSMMSAGASSSSLDTASSSQQHHLSASRAPPVVLSAEDEKTQLKRYYEAQDAVARHQAQQQQQGGSSSSAASAASPPLTRPAPAYASGYHFNGPTSASQGSMSKVNSSGSGSNLLPALASPNASFDNSNNSYMGSGGGGADLDDSSSVISIPYRSASVIAGKQRSAPSPTSSPPPPSLPTFSFSSLQGALPPSMGNGNAAVVGGAGGQQHRSSMYAPKMAPINWHEEEDEQHGQPQPPPPLPPKTPLSYDSSTMGRR